MTDHYLAEHTDAFHGPPTDTARLAGAGGTRNIPAYSAVNLPLLAANALIVLNGPHILTEPQGGALEAFYGLIGQDT